MFDKVSVNGYYSAPLFEFVKGKLPSTILGVKAEAITWNFTKVKRNFFFNFKSFYLTEKENQVKGLVHKKVHCLLKKILKHF
jgi:glutathione peroxidase-family protein